MTTIMVTHLSICVEIIYDTNHDLLVSGKDASMLRDIILLSDPFINNLASTEMYTSCARNLLACCQMSWVISSFSDCPNL